MDTSCYISIQPIRYCFNRPPRYYLVVCIPTSDHSDPLRDWSIHDLRGLIAPREQYIGQRERPAVIQTLCQAIETFKRRHRSRCRRQSENIPKASVSLPVAPHSHKQRPNEPSQAVGSIQSPTNPCFSELCRFHFWSSRPLQRRSLPYIVHPNTLLCLFRPRHRVLLCSQHTAQRTFLYQSSPSNLQTGDCNAHSDQHGSLQQRRPSPKDRYPATNSSFRQVRCPPCSFPPRLLLLPCLVYCAVPVGNTPPLAPFSFSSATAIVLSLTITPPCPPCPTRSLLLTHPTVRADYLLAAINQPASAASL